MFDTVDDLLDFMSDFAYAEFDYLHSPEETYSLLQGSCHDQTLFELQELSDMGLNPQAKFIIAVDEYGQGLETHSFVYYEENGKWYWIENAWEDMQGINEFDTYGDMLDAVMYAFGSRLPFDTLYVADFIPEEHDIGEDLDTLVDICMNSAEEYIID